jgi:hypothetical protein
MIGNWSGACDWESSSLSAQPPHTRVVRAVRQIKHIDLLRAHELGRSHAADRPAVLETIGKDNVRRADAVERVETPARGRLCRKMTQFEIDSTKHKRAIS